MSSLLYLQSMLACKDTYTLSTRVKYRIKDLRMLLGWTQRRTLVRYQVESREGPSYAIGLHQEKEIRMLLGWIQRRTLVCYLVGPRKGPSYAIGLDPKKMTNLTTSPQK